MSLVLNYKSGQNHLEKKQNKKAHLYQTQQRFYINNCSLHPLSNQPVLFNHSEAALIVLKWLHLARFH